MKVREDGRVVTGNMADETEGTCEGLQARSFCLLTCSLHARDLQYILGRYR